MALVDLKFRSGMDKDRTNYSNEGGWVDGDKVRFQNGFPQKIGGWARATSNRFLGICRQLFRWETTFGESMLALGTNTKLYIERRGELYDITPIRATFTTSDTDDCLEFSDGSRTVKVTIAGHGALAGHYVTISGVVESPPSSGTLFGVPIGELNTNHEVTSVASLSEFFIEVPTAATVSGPPTSGGGTSITVKFDINTGRERTLPGYGWGVMTWGRSTWGTEAPQSIPLMLRDWWFDRFDNDLVANIRQGRIYYWERGASAQPDTALATRAVELKDMPGARDVPTFAAQVMVSQDDRHLLAFGCTPFGETDGADPLLIRWASQDDPFDWRPEVTNSSGFLRVSRGRKIMRALATRQEILVWTESSLNALQFLANTDVFGLQVYAENISLMSPRAVVNSKDIVYWMGRGQFYSYSGRVEPMPCTVQEDVFSSINFYQADQVFAVTNERHHEIWWFYPSGTTERVNRYVVFNYVDNEWYSGSMERTAWIDSPEVASPQAVGYEHLIYDHEVGADADGQPLAAFVQSADVSLEQGNSLALMYRLLPDMTFRGSSAQTPEVDVLIFPRNFSGEDYRPDAYDKGRVISTKVDRFTDQVFIRARARHISLRVASEGLGVKWQLGTLRVDVKPSGRR